MDLSVKRMKTSSPHARAQQHQHHQRSVNMQMAPASHVNMSQLIKSEVIKKELVDSADNDRMSEKSDDSSDSGRLQMDISSQEDAEELRNLQGLKQIGRDTPESNFSDDHGLDADHPLWQAFAQHTQCKYKSSKLAIGVYLIIVFFL